MKTLAIRLLALFALIGLACITTWLMLNTKHSLNAHDAQSNKIDAYFKQVLYKQYNSQGDHVLTLRSPQVTLSKAEHTLTATKPRLTAFTQDHSFWTIMANKLLTDTSTQVSTLSGSVVLYQPANKNRASTTIKTQHLTLYPHDKAITDAPITLYTGSGSIITGKGCIVDLKTNTVEITKDAEATLQPSTDSGEK